MAGSAVYGAAWYFYCFIGLRDRARTRRAAIATLGMALAGAAVGSVPMISGSPPLPPLAALAQTNGMTLLCILAWFMVPPIFRIPADMRADPESEN